MILLIIFIFAILVAFCAHIFYILRYIRLPKMEGLMEISVGIMILLAVVICSAFWKSVCKNSDLDYLYRFDSKEYNHEKIKREIYLKNWWLIDPSFFVLKTKSNYEK
jgi:hypothetical protein